MKPKAEHVEERINILNKLFNILNINEDNNTLYLGDLDTNEEIQQKILDLEPEIKKYFACSKWACYNNLSMKRKILSLIKNLVKTMNYEVISKRKFRKNENGLYRDTIYYFIKNNSI